MWKYSQATGELFDPGGNIIGTGYAGKGSAKNDPAQQCVADTGPIPRGFYGIGAAANHPKLGPVAIPLNPEGNNQMCGRSGFFIHGDSVSDPGNASEGCIILKRATREEVKASVDKRLQVVRQSLLSNAVYREERELSAKLRAAGQIRLDGPRGARSRLTEGDQCDPLLSALGLSIGDLHLVDYAEKAAQKLLSYFPDVVFTSGRRDVGQQANAMAGNVVRNRVWIRETYSASPERDSLQAWVDANPDAITKDAIAVGLTGIMSSWNDGQKRNLSRHFSGQAFDVQPMVGPHGDHVKAAIRSLPKLRSFLDNEGGLIIWHADFELNAHQVTNHSQRRSAIRKRRVIL